MTRYEYKVLPAPAKGVKAKGARTTEARFAHALMVVMNELGRDGWEYQRTDTLPCEERVGLTGRATRFQNMLVFRRALAEKAEAAPGAITFLRNGVDTDPVEYFDDSEIEEHAADAAPKSGEETRESVADRLAATLTFADRGGRVPKVATTTEPGNAPKLGAATGNGLVQSGRPS